MFRHSLGGGEIVGLHIGEITAEQGAMTEDYGWGFSFFEFLVNAGRWVRSIHRPDKQAIHLPGQQTANAIRLALGVVKGLRDDDFVTHFMCLLFNRHERSRVHRIAECGNDQAKLLRAACA